MDPASVDYLRRFAEIRKRPLDPAAIEVLGEKLDDVRRPLHWEIDYGEVFKQAGIRGVTMQWPGDAFCINCAVCADFLVASFCKDNAGAKIEPVEYCFGDGPKVKENSRKVILFGDCAIRNNKTVTAAVKVKGCLPKIVDSMVAMINHSLDRKRARRVLVSRMAKGVLNKVGLYHEFFPRPYTYDPPEFDPAHF